MRRLAASILCSALISLALAAVATPAVAVACTPTGYWRDGINLTAAQIGGDVTGTLDATGCDIGVYYDTTNTGNVAGAEIFGARYYGVLANGGTVNVTDSSIHNIGDVPFSGAQHGTAVYYAYGSTSSGTVSGNTVFDYQKGGVVANGPGVSVEIDENTVTGLGPVPFIAQNGIQVGWGATAEVSENTVSGNWYTGAWWVSTGILLYGVGDGRVAGNRSSGDQVGVYVYGDRNELRENEVGGAFDEEGDAQPSAWGIILWGDANEAGENAVVCSEVGVDVFGNDNSVTENQIAGASEASPCQIGILVEKDAGVGTGNVIEENEFANVVQEVVDPQATTPLASPAYW